MNLRIQNLTILVRNIKTYYQVRRFPLRPGSAVRPQRRFPTGSGEETVVRHRRAAAWCVCTCVIFMGLVRRVRGGIAFLCPASVLGVVCKVSCLVLCGPQGRAQAPVAWGPAALGSGRGTLAGLSPTAQRVCTGAIQRVGGEEGPQEG